MSRKCGSLNISQPYGPPRPVTGIALFLYGIFNDSDSSSEYIVLSGRRISAGWFAKDVEGSGHGLFVGGD
jgi:hypothetical protein